MYEEFDTLMRNGAWSLAPSPKDTNIVGWKWLFCIKIQVDGSLALYKYWPVAKGFTQCHEVDFHETFSIVVRPQTIKIIFTISFGHRWTMHQLDGNNAFLLRFLQEQFYVIQTQRLKDSPHHHYVCKLHKVIYGLYQALWVWHGALESFTMSYDFSCIKSDPSLFIYEVTCIIDYPTVLC